MDKVELDFKHASTVRDRRRRQASCVHEQSDIPEMVFQRRERQADFPNDLRPHVQRAIGGFPFFQRQGGPVLLDHGHRRRLLENGRVLVGCNVQS